MDTRPLIVTARFDDELFAALDELRRRHFPPERNFIPAHATLFHNLPGGQLDVVSLDLLEICRSEPMPCTLPRLKFTGRGTHADLACEPLRSLRERLAARWDPWLTPQDRQPYRPHVTIQNKADPALARRTFDQLQIAWQPRHGRVTGLELWHYAGGPWEPAGRFDFTGL
jgi:2'-5' RNA ligase